MTIALLTDQKTDWGYCVVQQQPRNRSFGIRYELGFERNPPNSGFGFDLTLQRPLLITGVHGNVSVTAYGDDTNGSIVAVVYAMSADGDVEISSVKTVQLGRGSKDVAVNVPFPSAIPANALRLGWFVDQPGAQTISAGLVLTAKPHPKAAKK